MKKLYFFLALFMCCASFLKAQTPTIKWRYDLKDESFGQSCAADLDGDGKLEAVFGCYRNDSSIYVLNMENGTLLWKYNAGMDSGDGCSDAAPIIYDVDNDGQLDVIVASSCNAKAFCFNGKTGAVKWICDTRGSDSPPTIADIDDDGKPEILFGEFGGYVICINAEIGTVAWEILVDADSWIQTAPTITDLNKDGQLDFVVATWNAVEKNNNKVYAYKAKTQQLLWTYPLNDVVYHGTAVGDIDKDGYPELIIGSYNDTFYCINGENGSIKWKYNACNGCYGGAPAAIADLNNDGNCEVIITGWYKMVALRYDGSIFWQFNIPNYAGTFRGVAIADISNDVYKDVIFGTNEGTVIALNGNNGSMIFNKNLREDYGDSLFGFNNVPLVADFDKDGTKDIFIIGGHAVGPPNFQNNFGRAYMLSVGPGHGPDWLMFQHDIRRMSNLCENLNTSIDEFTANSFDFTLSPNPTSSDITVSVTLSHAQKISILVYGIDGRLVASLFQGEIAAGIHKFYWKPSDEKASGNYWTKVIAEEGTLVKQFIYWK